jgi:hypothetical protein
VFGFKQTSRTSAGEAQHSQRPAVRQVTFCTEEEEGPSYCQVVSEGSQSSNEYPQLRKLHGSAAARQSPSYSNQSRPTLNDYAPNGKKRTWGWKQRTANVDGKGRKPCNTPVTNTPGCEFYGDVLDLQGLCTYCTQPGHVRDDCTIYAKNVEKYNAAQKQENSR